MAKPGFQLEHSGSTVFSTIVLQWWEFIKYDGENMEYYNGYKIHNPKI